FRHASPWLSSPVSLFGRRKLAELARVARRRVSIAGFPGVFGEGLQDAPVTRMIFMGLAQHFERPRRVARVVQRDAVHIRESRLRRAQACRALELGQRIGKAFLADEGEPEGMVGL